MELIRNIKRRIRIIDKANVIKMFTFSFNWIDINLNVMNEANSFTYKWKVITSALLVLVNINLSIHRNSNSQNLRTFTGVRWNLNWNSNEEKSTCLYRKKSPTFLFSLQIKSVIKLAFINVIDIIILYRHA